MYPRIKKLDFSKGQTGHLMKAPPDLSQSQKTNPFIGSQLRTSQQDPSFTNSVVIFDAVRESSHPSHSILRRIALRALSPSTMTNVGLNDCNDGCQNRKNMVTIIDSRNRVPQVAYTLGYKWSYKIKSHTSKENSVTNNKREESPKSSSTDEPSHLQNDRICRPLGRGRSGPGRRRRHV